MTTTNPSSTLSLLPTPTHLPVVHHMVTIKLTRDNYLLWKIVMKNLRHSIEPQNRAFFSLGALRFSMLTNQHVSINHSIQYGESIVCFSSKSHHAP
jgi:hypothetical protein